MPWLDKSPVKSYRYRGKLSWVMLAIFVISFLWLGKIGAGPGTDPVETIIGRVLTFLYFVFFITMPLWTRLDKTRPVPEREIGRAHVRTHVTNAHIVCRLLLETKNKK